MHKGRKHESEADLLAKDKAQNKALKARQAEKKRVADYREHGTSVKDEMGKMYVPKRKNKKARKNYDDRVAAMKDKYGSA